MSTTHNVRVERAQQTATAARSDPAAAQLNVETGPGRGLQVSGHDPGRAPVEGERRDHHPPVPYRHQVGVPGAVLLLQEVDRTRSGRDAAE